jgi:hypothetical protein
MLESVSLEILTQRVFVALKCSAAFILAFLHLTSAFGTIIIFSFTADRVTVAADSRRGRLRGSEIPSLDQQHRGTPTNAGTRRFPCANSADQLNLLPGRSIPSG